MQADQNIRTSEATEQGLERGLEQDPRRRGLSWPAMLAWILAAFAVAGLVAWQLVTPFFHHG